MLIVEIIVFSLLIGERFLAFPTWVLIIQNASLVGIIMPFFACCLISGQIDLSIAPVGNLGALVFAMALSPNILGLPLIYSFGCALVFVLLIGLINSFLIIKVKIPGLVATLAIGVVCAGMAYLITDNFGQIAQLKIKTPAFRKLVTSGIFSTPFPLPVYLMAFFYFIYFFLLKHTKLGAHIYAVGGNSIAANLSGIKSTSITIFCMIGSCFGTVLASILLGVRLFTTGAPATFSAATASTGASAIPVPLVAAVIAGVSLTGGEGKLERTILGILFFSLLAFGMSMLNIPAQIRVALEGLAIVFAIVLDSLRRHLEKS